MNRFGSISVIAVIVLSGWSFGRDNEIPKEAKEAFDKAAQFELYSLDPDRLASKDEKVDLFHGWKVLGKIVVKGADAKKVRAAVEKGVRDSDGSVAACFNPRHGIRIVTDKKTYDLVICYECLSATVYQGEERAGSFLTARGPENALNGVLRDAKVPLPKSRKE
jgi:hypothetical protein